MNSKCQIVAFIFALCLVERLQGQFSPCEKCKNGPLPLKCSIRGCTSKPCFVYRGETAIGSVEAITNYSTSTLPVNAVIRLTGLPAIKVKEIKDEGCKYLPVYKGCPVQAGDLIVADIPYVIEKSWPLVNVTAEIQVTDGQSHMIGCARIPLCIADH